MDETTFKSLKADVVTEGIISVLWYDSSLQTDIGTENEEVFAY